ncbi:hypothetical protein ACFLXC_04640 [Chloroflexota bacterium]
METEKIMMGAMAALIGMAVIAGAVQTYTPTLDYVCPICGETFATHDALYQHFVQGHPSEPIDIIWG